MKNMEDKKITLSFMNEGKPFILPSMTVGKQDEYMEAFAKIEKEIKDEDKKNKEINKYLMLKTFQIVDKNVTMDDINNMHPSDYAYLSNIVWTKGKELNTGEPADFQKTK